MSRRQFHRPMIPVNGRSQVAGQILRANLTNLLAAAEGLHRSGNLPAALGGYKLLMQKLGPQDPVGRRATFMTAHCCFQMRIVDEAILLMEIVRDVDPNDANVHYNLGMFYGAAHRPQDAVDSYRFALALKPDFAAAENNLGNTLRELGDLEASQLCYDRLIESDPQDAHARYNLSHVLLLRGNLARGFQLYEDRWKVDGWIAEYGRPEITTPRLAPDDGPCRVFVYQEQGIGDTLQFLRYLPKLQALGHTVSFETPRELGPWFKRATLDGIVVSQKGEAIPAHDRSIPLLSLAAFFGTAHERDIPPILEPRVSRETPLWTAPGDDREVIGFAWAGSSGHHNDHHRSTSLDQIAELFTRPNTRFVSLQIGTRGVDLLSALPRLQLGEGSEIVECSAGLTDFEATAALVRSCTAVVCVDTSIAHLAGTLGVRTLLLTSWLSEWRWQLERTDSPWYPSVRVVRQPTLGDWPATAREALQLLEAV